MSEVARTSLPFLRRDYEKLSQRRRRVENRLARERARNARLAFGGFVLLALGLTVGLYSGWAPPGFGPPLASRSQPGGPGGFAQSRTGAILFSSFDGVICKELQFDNETGRLTGGKLVRCDEAQAPSATAVAPAGPQRALSIRNGFGR